jgi:hypothetical protein
MHVCMLQHAAMQCTTATGRSSCRMLHTQTCPPPHKHPLTHPPPPPPQELVHSRLQLIAHLDDAVLQAQQAQACLLSAQTALRLKTRDTDQAWAQAKAEAAERLVQACACSLLRAKQLRPEMPLLVAPATAMGLGESPSVDHRWRQPMEQQVAWQQDTAEMQVGDVWRCAAGRQLLAWQCRSGGAGHGSGRQVMPAAQLFCLGPCALHHKLPQCPLAPCSLLSSLLMARPHTCSVLE